MSYKLGRPRVIRATESFHVELQFDQPAVLEAVPAPERTHDFQVRVVLVGNTRTVKPIFVLIPNG